MRPWNDEDLGEEMYALAAKLFPLCRSITGDGVRQTVAILRKVVPELEVHEVPTGTRCFDWVIPDEWNIEDAYIARMDGTRLVDFRKSNLHVVGYSVPVDAVVSRDELDQHLHSRADLPDAVPYVTSYFKRTWGFCVSDRQRRQLTDPQYRVVVKSTLRPGSLTYADVLIPGHEESEVLFSTFVCHPSLGNNELSGVVVGAFLARYVLDRPDRRLSYRFVFVPETIGAVAYLSRHLEDMRRRTIAGFMLTCVGDDRAYSLLRSKWNDTEADRVADHVLRRLLNVPYSVHSFLERGADERQYSSPGVDIPVVSVMRSMYGTYPEYHTSLDNLDVISPRGLWGGFTANRWCMECVEANEVLRATTPCEPWLFPRGLRAPLVEGRGFAQWSKRLVDILAYADGTTDLVAMADLFDMPVLDLLPLVAQLKEHGLVETVPRAPGPNGRRRAALPHGGASGA
jgi:aminopeptidase-like protein